MVGNAYLGHQHSTRALLDSTKADLSVHDCGRATSEPWRLAATMLLSLGTHRWTRPEMALSKRSITAIVPKRRGASGFIEDVGPHTRKPSRFDNLNASETYKEASGLEMRAAAAFARSAEVLAEARLLGLAIDDLLVPMPDDDDAW